jgi:hypothetical protein
MNNTEDDFDEEERLQYVLSERLWGRKRVRKDIPTQHFVTESPTNLAILPSFFHRKTGILMSSFMKEKSIKTFFSFKHSLLNRAFEFSGTFVQLVSPTSCCFLDREMQRENLVLERFLFKRNSFEDIKFHQRSDSGSGVKSCNFWTANMIFDEGNHCRDTPSPSVLEVKKNNDSKKSISVHPGSENKRFADCSVIVCTLLKLNRTNRDFFSQWQS